MQLGDTLRLMEIAAQETPAELEEGFSAIADCSSISESLAVFF